MKYLFLFFTSLILSLTSCSKEENFNPSENNTNNSKIVGYWAYDSSTIKEITAKEDQIREKYRKELENLDLGASAFEFTEDGKILFYNFDGKQYSTGKYSYRNDTLKVDYNLEQSAFYLKITNSTFIYYQDYSMPDDVKKDPNLKAIVSHLFKRQEKAQQ